MTKTVPLFVALLFACSLPAMTVGAGAPAESQPVVDHPTLASPDRPTPLAQDYSTPMVVQTSGSADGETTTRLQLDGSVRSGYARSGPDLGTTLATDKDLLHEGYVVHGIEHRWADATPEERAELLDEALERTLERVEAFDAREAELVRARHEGRLTEGELVRSLVRAHAEAEALVRTLAELERYASEVPGYSVDVSDERRLLITHQGVVRSELSETVHGTDGDDSGPILVTTAESGVVVSAIDGDQYVREVVRFDARDPTTTDRFDDISEVADRVNEQYPWSIGDGVARSTSIEHVPGLQFFEIEASHPQGTLVAYLDDGSGEIFREQQVLSVDALPKTQLAQSWENDSLALSINETPRAGPMELTVADADTGEPVDATVAVDDREVATTGADGRVWILPPPGEFELAVEADDRSVTATLGD